MGKSKEEICMHLGDDYDRYLGAIVPPIFQNTLFTRKTTNHGYTYTRVSNPTIEIAEKKIADWRKEKRHYASLQEWARLARYSLAYWIRIVT